MEGWFDGIFAIRFMSEVIVFDRRADGSWREGQYSVEPDKNCAVVLLFSSENGEPLALLNDNWIQHMRVGGTAGLGTKVLARADAETVCMIGSGGMAQTFLEGVCVVRPIKRVRVHSPSRGNREAYAALMSERLGITVEAVDGRTDGDGGRRHCRDLHQLGHARDRGRLARTRHARRERRHQRGAARGGAALRRRGAPGHPLDGAG